MKKIIKKFSVISVCMCMIFGMTVSASASDIVPYGRPENAVYWRNGGNTNGYMNAYATTSSNVKNGTKVTQYTYTNDITQRFYTQNGYLKNACRTDLVVKKFFTANYDQEVRLSNNNVDAQLYFTNNNNVCTIRLAQTGELLAGREANNTSQTLWFDYAYEFTPYIYIGICSKYSRSV